MRKERQNSSRNYAVFRRASIGLEGSDQAKYLARIPRNERRVIFCGLGGSSAGGGVGIAGNIGGTHMMSPTGSLRTVWASSKITGGKRCAADRSGRAIGAGRDE
jgi:hypothetical protein